MAKTQTKCINLATNIYLLTAKIVYFKYILAADNLLTRQVIGPRTTAPFTNKPGSNEILFIA